MNIRKVSVKNFMSHREATWSLPSTGVVRVSGPNGAGKSSIIEAVAWCLWGKTLRGTNPFDTGGEVTVTTDALWVNRIRKETRTYLKWAFLGEEPIEYESTTKAASELQKALGVPFESWRRTSVFSSSDSALFATAPDAERKALLEQLLGIDRFDAALDSCKADIRAQEAKARAADSAVLLKQELLAGEVLNKGRLEDLISKDIPDIDALEIENGKLAGELCDVEQKLQVLTVEATRINEGIREYRQRIRELEASLARLQSGTCPTCAQDIPGVRVESLRGTIASTVNDNGAEITADEERYAGLQRAIRNLQDTQRTYRVRIDSNIRTMDVAREQAVQADRIRGELGGAEERIAVLSGGIARLKQERQQAYVELKELEACSTALGYRGIRNQLLAKALGGLEASCNAWLSRIAGRIWVKIDPYTERKSGAVSECIGLRIEGAGRGEGYRGCSGGERRRIDVALILALGEFAAASSGSSRGTIFCDEIFDALDTAGVQSVAEAIADISRERGVMVISHNAEVLNTLSGQHIKVGT